MNKAKMILENMDEGKVSGYYKVFQDLEKMRKKMDLVSDEAIFVSFLGDMALAMSSGNPDRVMHHATLLLDALGS